MDNFTIIEFIGEGSFGRVFKAKEKDSPAIVALKVIRKKGRSSKELKSLRQECDIQRHLDHPNIIRMLDSFETDTEMVVVTEFAEKELHSVLAKEGSLSEDQARAITWDLVSALYYLHSHRVLHRDLKPQNVLIDKSGHAKLCDFGLARNMTAATHVLTSIKGTPLYMAPELIDEKPYDHQADLWSLGCIVYELMAGQPPFCTTSIVQLVKMIRHKPVQWPTFITPEAFSFLQGLLHKDPASRIGWPEILAHPFVADHIFIRPEDMQCDSPFTRPLSESQMEAKQLQTAKLNNPQKVVTQAVHLLQKREHHVQSGRGLMHALENIQMSEDDSIRAMSALSIRDSLKTDDEDHSQPMTAANAKLLQHEYKVLDQQNLVVCNFENNMAQFCLEKNSNTKKEVLPNCKEPVFKTPTKLITKTEKEEAVQTPTKLGTKTDKEDGTKTPLTQVSKTEKEAGAKTPMKSTNQIELSDIAGYNKDEKKQKTETNDKFTTSMMLGTSSEESSAKKEKKASKSMGSTKTESSKHTVDTKGLSKSVPPSYKQKFLQFSLEKLKIGSSTNRLTRSIKKSLTFNWGSDKGKSRNKRRMSEPVVLDSSLSCTDFEAESVADESTSSTKDEEIVVPEKAPENRFETGTEKMSDYELISKYYDNCKPVLKEPLATAVELEEWQAFVYSTMQEVVAGDVTFLTQLNTVNMVLGFLRRAGADGGKLCGSIATLLSLPIVTQITREQLMDILDIYSETHVTLNLVYAIWVLMQGYNPCEPQDCEVRMDGVTKLVELLCALTIRSPPATRYMCCGFIALHAAPHLALIISLHEKHLRVSMNVIALMISILQELPENSRLVEEILFGVPKLDLLQFLFHTNNVFKVRMCVLFSLLCTYCCRALCNALKDVWTKEHREILQSWQSHSYELLSQAAKCTISELSNMPFYKTVL